MNPFSASSNAAGTAGGPGLHPSQGWVVRACVWFSRGLINRPSAGRVHAGSEGGGLQPSLGSIFTILSNAQTD